MKRVSAALAALFAVVLVGTASAKVPEGASATARLRQLGIMTPQALVPTPDAAEPAVSEVSETVSETGAEAVDPEVVDAVNTAIEDGAPLTDELLSGLPPEVAQILSALPFVPAPASETVAAPAPALVPEIGPAPVPAPAEQPKPAPAAKPRSTKRASAAKLRAAIGDREGVFPNLPSTAHAGRSTGSVIHVDTLAAAPAQLESLDVAFSAGIFTSSPIADVLRNEMNRITSQALGANSSYGRGSGVELSLLQPDGAEPQVILSQRAEAKAPPTTKLVSNQIETGVPGVLDAALLRGQAQALAAAACTTGIDLAFGDGFASDVALVGGALQTQPAAGATEAVSQSISRTRLIPQEGGSSGGIARFGLMSETRQIIAPVTVGPITIEFLGEWVLRAEADGKSVGRVHYGPGTASPATPALRILNSGTLVEEILTQDLLGDEGLNVTIPGVAEVAIGENPRAIGGDADSKPVETNTYAAGAVDVARITLLNGAAADVRVGHMEAAVAVPAGGIECGIGIVKTANPQRINAGESFTWNIKVSNPNDCVLRDVKVVDTISTPGTTGIKWTVTGSQPTATTMTNTNVTWNDIGPINPGGSKDLVISVTVDKTSSGGKFLDEAVVTALCGFADATADATAGAGAGTAAPLEARVSLNLPEVTAVLAEAPLRGELPRTGGVLAALPAFMLLGSGLALRRLRGRR